MTNEQAFKLLEAGHDRFRNIRNGRIYRVDPSQRDVLEFEDAALICYPEVKHPKKRGRAWTFICARNLEEA